MHFPLVFKTVSDQADSVSGVSYSFAEDQEQLVAHLGRDERLVVFDRDSGPDTLRNARAQKIKRLRQIYVVPTLIMYPGKS
jgi:hypothetical protein